VVNEHVKNGLTPTFTTDLTCFPTTEQNYPLARGETEKFEAQTRDPVTISGQISAVYTFSNIPQLFKEKRNPENAQVQALNALREALGVATQQLSITELYGPGRGAFGDSVKAIAQRKAGAHIQFKQVFINNLHAPAAIEAARISAAKKEQELDQAMKQLQIDSANSRGVIIKAEAEAQRQRLEAQALEQSPEVLKLKVAEAFARGMANACGSATTCILGGSVMDTWKGRAP
jgi:regulator of protease activity HflC (stomatin/prohibitin superfamily)